MATEFLMPKLGLTMEEGTITEWFADDGASITAGSPLLRIETDKTETDVEAAATGRLHRVGQVGETFACGERIGWFLAEGEDAPVATAPAASTGPSAAPGSAPPPTAAPSESAPAPVVHTGRVVATPLTKRLAAERNIDLRTVRGTGPGGRIVAADLDDLPASTAAVPSAPPSCSASTWPRFRSTRSSSASRRTPSPTTCAA
jgi:pyruvate dehydrogenase E2 component (dihydrolipoamide acetyltransferase)